MLYHLFKAMDFSVPGSGAFSYISFRAGMALIVSLIISLWFGKGIIKLLRRMQVGETVRDLGLEGQIQKQGTPTMGGLIILAATIIPTLLFARLTNIYILLMLVSTVWLGAIGFIDDYIKVFKKDKRGLAGTSKVISSLAFPGKLGSNDGLYSLDVSPGSYDFKVVPAGKTTPVVLDLPGTELSADTNYFVAAVGTLAKPQVVVKSTVIQQTAAEAPLGTIVDIASGNPDFSTLVTAVKAAGLVDTLSGEGPFTVFAPTNEAFAALGQDTINSVLANKELLTSILTYHVVAGQVMAADVVQLTSAKTVQGADIKITVKDGKVYLNDTIQVVTTDIQASNGIIHVIDGILMPPA